MSMNWRMVKKHVIYPCNRILFSNKKGWNSDTYKMDEPRNYNAKWEKPDTKKHIWFHLHEMSGISKSICRESRLVVTSSRGWGELEVTINGCGVTFWSDLKYFKIMVIVHNSVNYTKIIEFYTLNGWILWHVNYISRRLSLKKYHGWLNPKW